MTRIQKILSLSVLSIIFASTAFAQADTIPPYRKTPNIPAFRLMLPDSSFFTKSNFDKKSAVMIMLFNPQCEHCQHETEDLIAHIDQFKHIQILMATSMPFDSMKNFRDRYQLAKYDNIVVAHDPEFSLISFYSIHSLPSIALYNRKKEFIMLKEGGMKADAILELLQ